MGSLVDDLLHLARLDQGRPLERVPVDLVQLAEDAVRDAPAVAPDRAVRAVAAGPVVVLGDEARLHQVVANLVANALVHAPGAPIEVRVHAEGDRAVVEVADEGPGMAAADARPRLRALLPGRRVPQPAPAAAAASACRSSTPRCGPTAAPTSLTTAPGEGTTVRLELPLQAPQAAAPPLSR